MRGGGRCGRRRAPDRRRWAPSRCVSRRLARAALARAAFVRQRRGPVVARVDVGGRVGDAVTVRGGGWGGRRAGGGLRRGASPVDGLGRGGGHWGQSRALGRGKRRRGSTFGAASEVL